MNKVVSLILSLVDRMSGPLKGVKDSLSSVKKETDQASESVKKYDAASDAAGKQTGSFSQTLMNLARSPVAAAVGIGSLATSVVSLAKNFFTASADMEQYRISLGVLLGSQQSASYLIDQIKQKAKDSPYSTKELVEGSKALLAYGFSAGEILPTLDILGNLTAGLGREKMPNLIMAYGQVRTAQKLYGTELRQFTEAGVPLIEELSKVLGISAGDVRAYIEKVGVSSDVVTIALENLTKKGGKFGDLMKEQSDSAYGSLERLGDSFETLSTNIGNKFLKNVNSFFEATSKVISKTSEMIERDNRKQLEQDKKRLSEQEKLIQEYENSKSSIYKAAMSWKYDMLKEDTERLREQIQEQEKLLGAQYDKEKERQKTEKEKSDAVAKQKAEILAKQLEEEARIQNAHLSAMVAAQKTALEDVKKAADNAVKEYEGSLKTREADYIDFLDETNKRKAQGDKKAKKQTLDDLIALKKEELAVWTEYAKTGNAEAIKKAKELFKELNDLETKKAEEAQRQLEAFNRRAIDAGRKASTDFQGALADMANNVIFGPTGVAQKISDNISKALVSQGVQQSIATGLGGFMGGIGGSIVSQGIMGIVGDVFGNGKGKPIYQIIEEGFRETVDRVNDHLKNIGKEKTKIQDQLDIIDQEKRAKGLLGTVDDRSAALLEVQRGTTVAEAIQQLNDRLFGANQNELDAIKSQMKTLEKELQIAEYISANYRPNIGPFLTEADSRANTAKFINTINSASNVFGADAVDAYKTNYDESRVFGTNEKIIRKALEELKNQYGDVIGSDLSKTQLDTYAEQLRIKNEIADLLKEVQDLKKDSTPASVVNNSSSTVNTSNSTIDYDQLANVIASVVNSNQTTGQATVIQIDGRTIAEAIAPFIQSTQTLYQQGRL